jgi:hypothetical protein
VLPGAGVKGNDETCRFLARMYFCASIRAFARYRPDPFRRLCPQIPGWPGEFTPGAGIADATRAALPMQLPADPRSRLPAGSTAHRVHRDGFTSSWNIAPRPRGAIFHDPGCAAWRAISSPQAGAGPAPARDSKPSRCAASWLQAAGSVLPRPPSPVSTRRSPGLGRRPATRPKSRGWCAILCPCMPSGSFLPSRADLTSLARLPLVLEGRFHCGRSSPAEPDPSTW